MFQIRYGPNSLCFKLSMLENQKKIRFKIIKFQTHCVSNPLCFTLIVFQIEYVSNSLYVKLTMFQTHYVSNSLCFKLIMLQTALFFSLLIYRLFAAIRYLFCLSLFLSFFLSIVFSFVLSIFRFFFLHFWLFFFLHFCHSFFLSYFLSFCPQGSWSTRHRPTDPLPCFVHHGIPWGSYEAQPRGQGQSAKMRGSETEASKRNVPGGRSQAKVPKRQVQHPGSFAYSAEHSILFCFVSLLMFTWQ